VNELGGLQSYGINVDGRDLTIHSSKHPNMLDVKTLHELIRNALSGKFDDKTKFQEDMEAHKRYGDAGVVPPIFDEYGRLYPHWKDSRGQEFEPDDFDIKKWRQGY
jgi:hypothetical protein